MKSSHNVGKVAACLMGIVTLIQSSLWADEISLGVFGNVLKTNGGQPMPTSGLVLLVASTNDAVFGVPAAGNFVSGDDVVIARWDLSASGTPGLLLDGAYGLTFSGGWGAGDPLALYWYPTLNLNSLSPSNGVAYGFYRDAVGVDGSDPWVTPAGGTAFIDLKFKTADGGSSVNPASAGQAAWAVGNPFSTVIPVVSASGTSATVTFSGIPGHQYVTERSTNIVNSLGWVAISTNVVGSSGVFQVADTFSDLGVTPPPIPSPAFYRLRYDGP